MSIQVTGVLLNPIGQVSPKTVVRIISTSNVNGVLCGSPAEVVTGTDGSYDFPLVEGTFTLEVLYSSTYKLGGTVTITGATPTPITLEALFALAV